MSLLYTPCIRCALGNASGGSVELHVDKMGRVGRGLGVGERVHGVVHAHRVIDGRLAPAARQHPVRAPARFRGARRARARLPHGDSVLFHLLEHVERVDPAPMAQITRERLKLRSRENGSNYARTAPTTREQLYLHAERGQRPAAARRRTRGARGGGRGRDHSSSSYGSAPTSDTCAARGSRLLSTLALSSTLTESR